MSYHPELAPLPHEVLDRFMGWKLNQPSPIEEGLKLEIYFTGHTLMKQGDESTFMGWIAEGSADVIVEGSEDSHVIARLSEGDLVGEGVLFGDRRSATVVATTYLELYRLDRPELSMLQQADPALAAKVEETYARRLADKQDLP